MKPLKVDAALRVIVAHPFFALAREFNWADRQLDAAKKLIDITVIRIEQYFADDDDPTVRALVDQQAEDDGLWFNAKTAPEAHLQQALRALHAAIEASPSPSSVERLRPLIEQWRERKESAQQSGIRNGEVWPYDLGAFHALGRCLEELEALLSTPPGREK